ADILDELAREPAPDRVNKGDFLIDDEEGIIRAPPVGGKLETMKVLQAPIHDPHPPDALFQLGDHDVPLSQNGLERGALSLVDLPPAPSAQVPLHLIELFPADLPARVPLLENLQGGFVAAPAPAALAPEISNQVHG